MIVAVHTINLCDEALVITNTDSANDLCNSFSGGGGGMYLHRSDLLEAVLTDPSQDIYLTTCSVHRVQTSGPATVAIFQCWLTQLLPLIAQELLF